MVDEEGFQQVKNRRNARMNIFNVVNDEMRSSAYALAEEVRVARHRINPHCGEDSRRSVGQGDQEIGSPGRHKENAGLKDTEMRAQSEEPAENFLGGDTHILADKD